MEKRQVITDEEIQQCGWQPETILVEEGMLDTIAENKTMKGADEDVYIDGWSITQDDKLWWEMHRNSRRLLIVKKWYRNEVGQEWDTVMDIVISDAQELRQEMSWLKIPITDGKERMDSK